MGPNWKKKRHNYLRRSARSSIKISRRIKKMQVCWELGNLRDYRAGRSPSAKKMKTI